MATTTNFGWETPDDTDLVKDGAAAMRTLGNSIDTSFGDLKGGTSGQMLIKASNTDLDYTWVTPEIGDITKVTATSPLTGGGTSGDVTVGIQDATTSQKGAVQLEDSVASTSITKAATPNSVKTAYDLALAALPSANAYLAGKNKIINGDFGIWQRGTTFASVSSGSYTADRWRVNFDGTGAKTVSQQTFTPGTAPVAGYEGQYYFRLNQTTAGSGATYNAVQQTIEDVRTFAGQTVTFSIWAKADTARTVAIGLNQNFGSGGSSPVYGTTQNISVTTSWQRFTLTFSVASVSGKTIGTSSFLELSINLPINTTQTIDIWGGQLEPGSTATPFQTATGTKQGELAACQRYYYRSIAGNSYGWLGNGIGQGTTTAIVGCPLPVMMRVVPTSVDYATLSLVDGTNTIAITSIAMNTYRSSATIGTVDVTVASGLTQYRPYYLNQNASSGGYIGFSAEL